jgi:acyl-CoA reductase-like NAD-dependent aldehyde dehydrogenase
VLSPYYQVLVEEIVREEFVDELCKAMDEYYPVSSYADDGAVGGGGIGRGRRRGDVGRMISVRHAERVVGLVDSTCRVIYGGRHHDVGRRFVAPTIVEATFDSTVMREEVFGPVLAIVPVPSVDDALRLVNERFTSRAEHPLVLYIFSGLRVEQQKIAGAVPSGMCSINEVLKIGANWNLPFGGVGASGMGAANGRHGFDFFSHRRGTLVSGNRSTSSWDPSVWVITPPFDDRKRFAFQCIAKVPAVLDPQKPNMTRVVVPIALAIVCSRFIPAF